jgi:signal transduction histidine kinase
LISNRRRRRLSLSGSGRVWVLTSLIAGAALALYGTQVVHLPRPQIPFSIEWWVIAIVFFFAETHVVYLEFRRDAHSFSLTEIPLILGLFFLSPPALLAAQLAGGALALVVRRQSPVKLGFNLANLCLNAAIAVQIFHWLGGPNDPISTRTLVAALVAALVWGLITPVLINCAIFLSGGGLPSRAWSETLGIAALVTATNTCLALAGVIIAWSGNPSGVWLLVLPTLGLVFISRFYSAERQKHDSVEFLYQSTRILHRSLQMDSALLALLSQAREMFRAEIAEIVLLPSDGDETALSTILGPGDDLQAMKPVELRPTEGVWARIASEAQPLLIEKPIENQRLRDHFAERGIKDAMVAPLLGNEKVIGTMMVANRLGDVSTFDRGDLKLFETLANHASVSLENAQLVGRLEDSLSRLTEMNRLKDDFVASVSHELRTPLTSIQGYVATLLRHRGKIGREREQSFLEEVERQTHFLRRLIEDLLTVSRLEATGDHPRVTKVTIPALARRVVSELHMDSQGHSFEFQFDESLSTVETDEDKVHQILTNLIQNALKYAPPRTKVTVTSSRDDSGIIISVRDEGPGIPFHLREKIFDRFYQIDQSSTRSAGGTGLGLYICRRLAEIIGGRVWLEHSDESGSTFSLSIPEGPIEQEGRVIPLRRMESA